MNQFNIQIDNPCAVMTQDTSRSFISSSPHDKYKFFLKATQLQRMREDLDEAKKNKDFIETSLLAKKDAYIEMEEQRKKLEQERKDAEKVQELEEIFIKLTNEQAWATVIDLEKVIKLSPSLSFRNKNSHDPSSPSIENKKSRKQI